MSMEYEYYDNHCSTCKFSFSRIKIENAELKEQIKDIVSENEKMQDQLLQYDGLLKEKNREIKEFYAENQELAKKVDSYEQRIDELVLALHDAETENKVLRELLLENGKPVAKVKINPRQEVKRYSCENRETANG